MIITQTPLRISFLGGGTDYPEHFEKHTGAVLGTVLIQYLTTWLGQSKSVAALLGVSKIDTSLVLGIVLILFVLLVPGGFVPTLRKLLPLRGSAGT